MGFFRVGAAGGLVLVVVVVIESVVVAFCAELARLGWVCRPRTAVVGTPRVEGGLPLLPMAGMEVRLEILRLGAEEVEPKVRLLSSFTSSRLVLPSRSLTLACMDSSTSIPFSPDPPVLSFRALVLFVDWVLREDLSFSFSF